MRQANVLNSIATMKRINEREEREVFHRHSQVDGQHDVWAQSVLRTYIRVWLAGCSLLVYHSITSVSASAANVEAAEISPSFNYD